ncbi:SCO-spondin-like [Patiria miniata]|uniref:VWFC domain-containing protein n=1 Tax=Patiria miniata TaxID=46514 RepID=A0A913Z0A8_PATMI|nr:SCO-spondin-like [Patiria miniata]
MRFRVCQDEVECVGGKGAEKETKACNTDPCPVNGNWTMWTPWSECDHSCGGGIQYRLRTCTNPPPKNGGLSCGKTKEEVETSMCNTEPCEEPCEEGTVFDDCNKPLPCQRTCLEMRNDVVCLNSTACTPSCRCDEGSVFNNEGLCVPISECSCNMDGKVYRPGETFINEKECSICECTSGRMECRDTPCDGGWSGWTVWSSCDKTCGWGTRLRFRSCTNPIPRNGGKNCTEDGRMEVGRCNEFACVVDGKPGPWGMWSVCTATCGGGTQHRKRSCNSPVPQNGGDECTGVLREETRPCGLEKCQDGCGAGMEFVPCGSTCQPIHCQQLATQADCIDEECHSLCRCKDGRLLQNGTCVEPHQCQCMVDLGGDQLQELLPMESVIIGCQNCTCKNGVLNCTGDNCVVNGNFSDWTPWEQCDRDCGSGFHRRYRSCTNPAPRNGGKSCIGTHMQKMPCDGLKPCPVIPGWSTWFPWSDCDVSCGGGMQVRTRLCNSPAPDPDSMLVCEGAQNQTRSCNTEVCPQASCYQLLPLPSNAPTSLAFSDVPSSGWKPSSAGPVVSFSFPQQKQITALEVRGGGRGTGAFVRRMEISYRVSKYDAMEPIRDGKNQTMMFEVNKNDVDNEVINLPQPGIVASSLSVMVTNATQKARLQLGLRGCQPVCAGDKIEQDCGQRCPKTCAELRGDSVCVEEECKMGCFCREGYVELDGKCVPPEECPCFLSKTVILNLRLMTGEPPLENTNKSDCLPLALDQKGNRMVHGDMILPGSVAFTPCNNCTCVNGKMECTKERCQETVTQSSSCESSGTCAVDCTWNEWTKWSACTRTCGVGQQRRTRSFNPAMYGGKECDNKNDTVETKPCSLLACPVNGGYFQWSEWSNCTKSCDGGNTERMRKCNNPTPKNGGEPCRGPAKQTKTCNSEPCGPKCTGGKIYDSKCGNRCPSQCAQLQSGSACNEDERCQPGCRCRDGWLEDSDGKCIPQDMCECLDAEGRLWPPNSKYNIDCNTCICQNGKITCSENDCPVDCGFSAWSTWSTCQHTCGDSDKIRFRSANNPPADYGGRPCEGATTESKSCGLPDCPVFCSADNGRVYLEGEEVSNDGCNACTCNSGFIRCTNNTCAAALKPEWSPWSPCDATCGYNGRRVRSLSCQPDKNDSSCVNGVKMESRKCDLLPCPVDGNWCEWSPWSICSVSCGVGQVKRSRECMCGEPLNGGKECEGKGAETQACFLEACPVDCVWDEWSPWSECTAVCGTQEQISTRTRQRAGNGGRECEGPEIRTKLCNLPPCRRCVSPFVNRACATTCPRSCRDLRKNTECMMPRRCEGGCMCPGDYLLQDDGCVKPSECRCTVALSDLPGLPDSSLDQLLRPTSSPGIYQMNPGDVIDVNCNKCECAVGQLQCTNKSCKVPGGWSAWTEWFGCTESCSDGPVYELRFRSCNSPEPKPALSEGGNGCEGESMERKICAEVTPCPVDCKYGPWLEWSGCDAPCGGGSQTRRRDIIIEAKYGGRPCQEELMQSQPCNPEPCPGELCGEIGMIYDECATRCPLTCKDLSIPCLQPTCQPGCRCKEGEYLQDGNCVTQKECRCVFDMTEMAKEMQRYSKMFIDEEDVIPQMPPPPLYHESCSKPIPLPPNAPASLALDSKPDNNNIYGWSGDHLTLTFDTTHHITGLNVQGGGALSGDYLERLIVLYRMAEPTGLRPVLSDDGLTPMIFHGNTDPITILEIHLPYGGVMATSVTILPVVAKGNKFRLRLQLLSCPKDEQARLSQASLPNQKEDTPSTSISRALLTPTLSTRLPMGYQTMLGSPPGLTINEAYQPGSVLDFPCSQCNCSGGVFMCIDLPCPHFDSWTTWTNCTALCCGGYQYRSRECLDATAEKDCEGSRLQTRRCNIEPCPVDCQWDVWTSWSSCSASCNGGHRLRTRLILIPALFGGRACNGAREELIPCNTQPCLTCPRGTIRSSCGNRCPRECSDIHDGIECLNDVQGCQDGCVCPDGMLLQDFQCVPISKCRCVADESVFGILPATSNRSRNLLGSMEYQPGDVVYKQCNKCTCERGHFHCTNQNCRMDCGWSEWSDWSDCSVTCGSGVKKAYRTPDNPVRAYGGAECEGPSQKEEICYAGDCECGGNEIFSKSATLCRPKCQDIHTYQDRITIQDKDTTQDQSLCGQPYEACVCQTGFYLNSTGGCVPPHQCECVDEEGLPRKPNEEWRPDDCSVCSCRNGIVTCGTECDVMSCSEENYELVYEPGKCCPVCRKRFGHVETCRLELVTRNITNSAGCRANDVQLSVCMGTCSPSNEIILSEHPEFSVCRCCQGILERVDGVKEAEEVDIEIVALVCEDGSMVEMPVAKYTGCTCQQPCGESAIYEALP